MPWSMRRKEKVSFWDMFQETGAVFEFRHQQEGVCVELCRKEGPQEVRKLRYPRRRKAAAAAYEKPRACHICTELTLSYFLRNKAQTFCMHPGPCDVGTWYLVRLYSPA